jgi:hypothetical protein
MCRLPEDGGVPPKHVRVNKRLTVVHIICAFVDLLKDK